MNEKSLDETPPAVVEITPEALKAELLGSHPPRLLDVREPEEWRQMRIPGEVIYMRMDEIPDRLDELDPAERYVVLCAHGNRSYVVTEFMSRQGYQARSLQGGIVAWARSRGPFERG